MPPIQTYMPAPLTTSSPGDFLEAYAGRAKESIINEVKDLSWSYFGSNIGNITGQFYEYKILHPNMKNPLNLPGGFFDGFYKNNSPMGAFTRNVLLCGSVASLLTSLGESIANNRRGDEMLYHAVWDTIVTGGLGSYSSAAIGARIGMAVGSFAPGLGTVAGFIAGSLCGAAVMYGSDVIKREIEG